MLALALSALLAASPAQDDVAWHRLVGLIQYLAGDYAGAVKDKNADELWGEGTFGAGGLGLSGYGEGGGGSGEGYGLA